MGFFLSGTKSVKSHNLRVERDRVAKKAREYTKFDERVDEGKGPMHPSRDRNSRHAPKEEGSGGRKVGKKGKYKEEKNPADMSR